jgi:diguanylate cyclase (GGDEF)-like protein
MGAMWRMLLLIVAAAGAWGAVPAAAAPASAGVGPLCFAPARAGDTAAAMFAQPRRFRCGVAQSTLPAGDWWVRPARPLPRLAPSAAVDVRFASLWQDRVELWARLPGGRLAHVGAHRRSIGRHLQLGAIVAYRLPVAADAPDALLWRVTGAANLRGVLLGAEIATPEHSAQANLLMAAIYAGFAGMCLALLFYNLAVWAALRHRFQLAYCTMVAALLAYAFTSSGVLAWLWPGFDNNLRLRLNYMGLAAATAAAVFFARTFFEPRVFAGRLGRAARGVSALLLWAGALVMVAPDRWAPLADTVFNGSFLALPLLIAGLLWRASRLRSRYLGSFALAWSAPVLLASMRLAHAFHWVGWHFWLDNSTIAAMALEALLSSLVIAYRVRQLSDERDEAREQEVAARLLADTDPLTGLPNRRAFLREAIGREGSQRLILADIDHFKAVNETLGHDGGDEVLRRVARALSAAAPEATVARLGGEEFAVLAPLAEAPDEEALLDAVRTAPMPFDLRVTVSLGHCVGTVATEPGWKAIYAAADRALFGAKRAGRDRARGAPPLARAA